MDGDGKNPVFRSDDINASKNSKHNYFVNIIKNPFFLRQKPVKSEPTPAPEAPKPAPAPEPVKEKNPQLRATFRIARYSAKERELSSSSRRYILCGILAVVIICITTIVLVSLRINRQSVEKNDEQSEKIEITSEEEILKLRKELSQIAYEIAANKESTRGDFVEALNDKLYSVDNTAAYRSLNIFAIYILTRHGFYSSAMTEFENLMIEEDLTSSDKCELYEYRAIIAKYSSDDTYDAEENESVRAKYCEEALSLEENQKQPLETNFAYAERLYFRGFLTNAISALENLDYTTLSDSEKLSTYNYLADYYFSTLDTEKYDAVYAKLIKIRASLNENTTE